MIRRVAVFCICILFLNSCGTEDVNPDGVDEEGNPPVGVVDDAAGFYVRTKKMKEADFPIHAGLSTFSTACEATTGQLIDCYVEGEENDIYYHPMTLHYNIPSSMCSYLNFMPYYYWAYESDSGPSVIRIDTDKNGDVGIDTDSDGVIDGPTTTSCQYNYSPDGPNCCTGYYTQVLRTWDATGAKYVTATTPGLSWGGTPSSCIAGPAVDTQPKTKNGFPRPVMTYVEGGGLNNIYEIASPISKSLRSNIYVSNYFNIADHGGSMPAAVAFAYYDFQCLDRAYEFIAQIRVMVREWNTDAAFHARVSAPTAHDLIGDETWPTLGIPLNDWRDWKDWEAVRPGAYPNGDNT